MPQRIAVVTNDSGRITSSSARPVGAFPTREEFLLFPDGWLAIARLDPFRIDWRSPDGRWSLGQPLPVPLVALDRRERLAHVRRATPGSPRWSENDDNAWPKFVPPFPFFGPLLATADGKLVIARTKSADHEGNRYLLINRSGRVEGEISLPANETILAFGRASVYVIVRDDDDVQHLRRHHWP